MDIGIWWHFLRIGVGGGEGDEDERDFISLIFILKIVTDKEEAKKKG